MLARRGYEIAGEAETVAAALRLAESVQPDAALVDIRLPDGDGFELATLTEPDLAARIEFDAFWPREDRE
jgi:DNA-binding NarL/FixJ family response regulator